MTRTYRYFMSANGYGGFTSLYEKFGEESEKFYIVKGGPGCGKSGFMKRIGEMCSDCGVYVEYIHCAGDPDSVDGLIVPELGCAFADGTRPHVIEPELAGCTGAYIDLGRFCDFDSVSRFRTEITALETEWKRYTGRANALLASAGKAVEGVCLRLQTKDAVKGAEKRALGISGREFKRQKSRGKSKIRFISAFTYKGLTTMNDTVENQCGRLYIIDDDYGLGEHMLRVLEDETMKNGYDSILCMSPLEPEKPEALLVPEVSAAFICGESSKNFFEPYRHIRLDAYIDRDILTKEKKGIKGAVKLRSAALEQAKICLESGKNFHDKIEEIYNPYVDFDGVYSCAERYGKEILDTK